MFVVRSDKELHFRKHGQDNITDHATWYIREGWGIRSNNGTYTLLSGRIRPGKEVRFFISSKDKAKIKLAKEWLPKIVKDCTIPAFTFDGAL